MSDVNEDPFKWRRHKGWFYFSKMLAVLAALGYGIHWFMQQI